MRTMDRDEWLEFVHHGTRTGKLAVTRADGSPHVTPIWFLIDPVGDADQIVFTTSATTTKGRSLRRDPRLSMCVDLDQPPYSYVHFQAEAALHDDLNEMLHWATRLGARYMGEERAEAFGKRNAVPGELLVRATITRVIAQADVAD